MAASTQVKMAATTESPSITTTAPIKAEKATVKGPVAAGPSATVSTIRTLKAVPQANSTNADNKKTELDTTEPPASKKPALEQRYEEFLKLVNEIGKDVKPAYTNSKSHGDRLKRNITTARGILRECLGELDRLSRQETAAAVKSNSPSLKSN